MLVSVCTNCLTSLPCAPTNTSGKKAPVPNPGILPVFDNNSFTLFSANPNELKLPAVLDFSTASLTSFNLSDSLEVIVGGLASTRLPPIDSTSTNPLSPKLTASWIFKSWINFGESGSKEVPFFFAPATSNF